MRLAGVAGSPASEKAAMMHAKRMKLSWMLTENERTFGRLW